MWYIETKRLPCTLNASSLTKYLYVSITYIHRNFQSVKYKQFFFAFT